jgi:hypothetical protein
MSFATFDTRRFRACALSMLGVSLMFLSFASNAAIPVISGTPPTTVAYNATYSFTPRAYDPDGTPVKFWIANRPWWASFDPATGRLWGKARGTGTYSNILIYANSGGQNSKPLPAFSITVINGTNAAPKISGTPPTTATVGKTYRFQPTASDANGDKLTFSIANKPRWTTFSTSTGVLSGTPTSAHVGTYGNITIRVSDGKTTASLPAFSIRVAQSGTTTTNGAPTISGTPATSVTVGNTYRFQPTAKDPNGDTLGFSISNRPTWATFNTSTGVLSGTPTLANVGTYSNITIRVSDGKSTASLPPFAITVSQSSSGTVSLSWTPPTRNTNGTSLTNLAGYRIYYGTSSSALTNQIQIANASTSRYVIQNLSKGTYYFGVRAYNTAGTESALSNIASKTIQ